MNTIDNETLDKIVNHYESNRTDFEYLLRFFQDTIKPEIVKNYLSHFVNAVADIINEKKRKKLLADIKSIRPQEYFDKLQTTLALQKVRLFSVRLIPMKDFKKSAYTIIKDDTALIYYDDKLDEKQKRLFIAHEMGHILLKYVLFDRFEHNEKNASLIGLIAMIDKNNFYRDICQKYTYKSTEELINVYMDIVK